VVFVGKGKMMKFLEELEKRVLQIIHSNEELRLKLNALTNENAALRQQNQQIETSLMKEVTAAQVLASEQAAIKNTIEELLNSINALENSH
jgi:regulator of replication initiation timing